MIDAVRYHRRIGLDYVMHEVCLGTLFPKKKKNACVYGRRWERSTCYREASARGGHLWSYDIGLESRFACNVCLGYGMGNGLAPRGPIGLVGLKFV